MTSAEKTFVNILRCHLTGAPLQLPPQPDWDGVLSLAGLHSLQAVVFHTLRGQDLPEHVRKALQKGFHTTIYMDTQLDHVRLQITEEFDSAQIPYIFLRGICLKHAYPVPSLRSMSDMDVLVHTRDYGAIHGIMEKLGARLVEQDDNHRSYLSPAGALVEFHPNLLRHTSPGASAVNPGWQLVSDPSSHRLSPEGEYLNTLCHMIHHFAGGGTGVRSVMDVWVSLHSLPAADREAVERQLANSGLLTLVRNIEDLANAWFSDAPFTPLLEELGAYILTCGTYGTEERAYLSNAGLAGGKWSALRNKLFPKREVLEDTCPWSKGKPLLLPAAWMARLWHKSTRNKGEALKRWSRDGMAVTDEAVKAHTDLLRRFGLNI